jgi:hypothetical protein
MVRLSTQLHFSFWQHFAQAALAIRSGSACNVALRRDSASLNCLGDCFSIAIGVLLPLRMRPDVFRGHEPQVATESPELAAKIMRADVSFHADQVHISRRISR